MFSDLKFLFDVEIKIFVTSCYVPLVGGTNLKAYWVLTKLLLNEEADNPHYFTPTEVSRENSIAVTSSFVFEAFT